MENINTINQYREIYKYHKKNYEDKQFTEEYYSELSVYKIATKEILKIIKNYHIQKKYYQISINCNKKEYPYAGVFFE